MDETISACKVLIDKYKNDEDFKNAVHVCIASAITDMPVGNIDSQAAFIADRFFGCD